MTRTRPLQVVASSRFAHSAVQARGDGFWTTTAESTLPDRVGGRDRPLLSRASTTLSLAGYSISLRVK